MPGTVATLCRTPCAPTAARSFNNVKESKPTKTLSGVDMYACSPRAHPCIAARGLATRGQAVFVVSFCVLPRASELGGARGHVAPQQLLRRCSHSWQARPQTLEIGAQHSTLVQGKSDVVHARRVRAVVDAATRDPLMWLSSICPFN